MYDSKLKDFAIWYDPPRPGSSMTVLNNGHTGKGGSTRGRGVQQALGARVRGVQQAMDTRGQQAITGHKEMREREREGVERERER